MKKRLLLLFLLVGLGAFAQFSKTHYMPPVSASDSVEPEDQYIYISTPSLTPVNFQIIFNTGQPVSGTVSRDTPFVYELGSGSFTRMIIPPTSVAIPQSNKGFIVEAEDLVYVSVRLIAGSGNQAGMVVSKGMAALGTRFRTGGFTNSLITNYQENYYTFISVMATENNTTVNFSNLKSGIAMLNSPTSSNNPFDVTLNRGQSYAIAVRGPLNVNRDALIGTLVTSDKPIALNCGSFGGSNGEMQNIDLGFDQIVSAERTGQDFIFIKSTGLPNVETVLLVADEDATDVFLSGETTPSYTIDAGEYLLLNGSSYTANGNLFIHTSKNVFAYQSIGDNGRTDQANQELFFVPPLSCETPKAIDNIPIINRVGTRVFDGRVTLVTETGSTLNFIVSGQEFTLAELDATAATVTGPTPVIGNPGFETYSITGLTGNVSVYSTTQLYLASYGSSEAATFGGYYSGFTFKPEVTFSALDANASDCLPNISLKVNEITGFDTYQWFFNDVAIPGADESSYTPSQPGYYYVRAAIASCGTDLESDNIPVSLCPDDSDQDGTPDNIDLDRDNDGIVNCAESLGDAVANMANPLSGTISTAGYTNSFTGVFPTGTGTPSALPFQSDASGNFATEVTPGIGNTTMYRMNFAQAVSLKIDYPMSAVFGSYEADSRGQFALSVPITRTITVLNPDNQLLIDTNYDGIYESGVTEFSSFEIRFRVNSTSPIGFGGGTFSFHTFNTTALYFSHANLSDSGNSRSAFHLFASCVRRDSDGDGVADSEDFDSDNDGIPDLYESQGANFTALSGNDANRDGIDDIFGEGISPADTDSDGVPDFLDLDSDNNGIFDLTEAQSGGPDTDNNGVLDGNAAAFGVNGLRNSLESSADSGILNFTLADSDSDGLFDYLSPDNDADGCNDVLEAGFSDPDNDSYLGSGTPPVNSKGVVTGSGGYSAPNPDYNIPSPIVLSQQPQLPNAVCEGETVSIPIGAGPEIAFQWQVDTGSGTFANLANGAVYSGVTTSELVISAVTPAMDGYRFRALLSRFGNVCGSISDDTTLHVNDRPEAATHTLVQCDTGDAPDGITIFNLSEADGSFTGGNANLSIAYYSSAADVENGVPALSNDFTNSANPQQIAVLVTDSVSGCANWSVLNLSVNVLPNVTLPAIGICDDASEDGFEIFDLTMTGIPETGGQSVRFYETEDDALLERNAIADPSAYMNLSSYSAQTVFARLESGNDCSRLYRIPIVVHRLPPIDANLELSAQVVCVNTPEFSTVLEVELLDSSAASAYQYQWFYEGEPLVGETAPTLSVTNQEGLYSVRLTNAEGCEKTRFIPVVHSSAAIIDSVVVADLEEPYSVTVNLGADSYGDYVYSIDHENAFTASNVLTNLPPGFHTVYVKDLNGCETVSYEIAVVGIPKFFTPNADGYNDTWNVKGISAFSNANSTIYIFDRYGKLLKQLGAAGEGWDGTYNGNPLPADDYWFSVELEDGRSAKGHFTLKR